MNPPYKQDIFYVMFECKWTKIQGSYIQPAGTLNTQ